MFRLKSLLLSTIFVLLQSTFFNANAQTSYTMCATANASTTNLTGTLYDSGGPSGGYQNGQNCSFLINPGCASSITLNFTSFNTEGGFDYFTVYNGVNASAPQLGSYSGTTVPTSLVANSGKMFITWYTDGSVTSTGFAVNWTSVTSGTLTPVANFSVSSATPAFGASVQFTDLTTNSPLSWSWDFGDGGTSTVQNPTHTYTSAGVKTIRLISTNCTTSDTAFQNITVQNPPNLNVSPDTLNLTVSCGDSVIVPIIFQNIGTGALNYTSPSTSSDTVRILTCTYGADLSIGGEYANMLTSVSQYFNKHTVTQYTGNTASGLQTALTGKDVIMFTDQESLTGTHYATYATTLQNFVTAGGIVIFTGAPGTIAPNRIFDSGLFTGTNSGYLNSGTLNVVNLTDSITNDLTTTTTNALNATEYFTITNSDKISLVKYATTYDVVFYRNIGLGKAIVLGADYFSMSTDFSKMIAASVKLAEGSGSQAYILQNAGTINQGQSLVRNLVLRPQGQSAGTYSTVVNVFSNDPTPSPYPIIVNYTVVGSPSASLSANCINYGAIMQYSTKTDSVKITNNGCSNLTVSSMNTNTSYFTFTPSTFSLTPGQTRNVTVQFTPTALGNVVDTLYIYNNDTLKKVCLTGTSTVPPEIVSSHTDINVSIPACSNEETVSITLENVGGIDLNYSIQGSESSGQVAVLAYTNGVDMAGEYLNTINAINQYYTNYTVTTFTSGTTSQLQTALTDKNVLLIPELETYSVPFTQYATTIQNFANAGGTVIICGSAANVLNDVGIFTNTGGIATLNTGTISILDTTHFLTNNVPLSIAANNATMYTTITQTGVTKLGKYTGTYDVVAVKDYNNGGKAIYIGFDFYAYDNNAARLISNAVSSPNISSLPQWLSVSPGSGSISSGNSTTIDVTFNSGSLTAGTYTTNIIIESNDPLNPTLTIPVTMQVGNNPCVDFTNSTPATCSGVVNFNDSIINTVTSQTWNFGDGGTSNASNPTHNYTAAGTYTVSLIGCNGADCDTASHTVVITGAGGPLSYSCAPTSTSYCCGMGITNVTLNTINKTSSDGSVGYEDFSCTNQTTLTIGTAYQLSVTTGTTYQEYVSAWIDYDNSGTFSTAEQVMNNIYGMGLHQITINLPSVVTINTPLRMRVLSNYYTLPNECATGLYGQGEDYTVIIQPNTIPPDANFTTTSVNSCQGKVILQDNSTNYPTSWLWNFGDGNASVQQNPMHTYTSPGTYTITLIATNQYGSDFYTQTVTVNPLVFTISNSGNLISGQSIDFSSSLSSASSYTWNFGDGYLAGLATPSHTYSTPGTYIVSLTAISGSCVNTVSDTLVIVAGVGLQTANNTQSIFTVYPNPSAGNAVVSFELTDAEVIEIDLINITGQKIMTLLPKQRLDKGSKQVEFSNVAAGVYFVRINSTKDSKLIKYVSLGNK